MIASYGIDVDYKRRFLGDLFYSELWWRNHQPWLLTQGYSLRPRYEPNWIPSWQRDPTKMRQDAEDSVESQVSISVLALLGADSVYVYFSEHK